MAEMTPYVALKPFSMSYQKSGKMESLSLKTGEEFLFDGLYFEYRGDKGQVESLCKVIGDWVAPVDGSIPVSIPVQQGAPSTRSRNSFGGREVEESSPENDLGVKVQQESSNQEMNRLLKMDVKPQKTEVVSDMHDIKKEVNIIDDDTSVVAQVRKTDSTATKNTSGVQIDQKLEAKRPVMSQEGQMVKKTAYNKTEEEPVRKRLVVDKEVQGVEVGKTSTASKTITVVKDTPKKPVVVREEDSVIETNYGTQKSTDVGSSTQSKVESDVILSKTATVAKSSKIIRETVRDDSVVVGKVSKNRQNSFMTADNPNVSQGGITAKLTVGPEGNIDVGEVQFASSGDGIEMSDVTFGDAKSKNVDVSDEAIIIDNDDIDVDDILGKL